MKRNSMLTKSVPVKEMCVVVAYDIEKNKIRSKFFEACKDYGLSSFQYSTFIGTLSKVKIKELKARFDMELADNAGTYIIIPICDSDYKKILWKGEPLSLFQKSLSIIV